jgi:nitrite reductase/ring-hydroxylating ferredoxin subunit
MIGRLLLALVDLQTTWARPLGRLLQKLGQTVFGRIKPLKDFLNGKWLGHSLHAATSDLPVGAVTVALVLDLLANRGAADAVLAVGVVSMAGAAIAGMADLTDTDDRARTVGALHATLMSLALLVLLVSLVLRLADPAGDRAPAILLLAGGWLVMLLGAWVGGEIVFGLGNMVNRHAWRFGGTPKWIKIDLPEIPEGRPIKARAGRQAILLFRQGETIHALHDMCAHAGGPLSAGRVVDGCIECPWHGSRFELDSGRRKSGPTTFDQPRYEIRAADGGGWEVRRMAADTGADS